MKKAFLPIASTFPAMFRHPEKRGLDVARPVLFRFSLAVALLLCNRLVADFHVAPGAAESGAGTPDAPFSCLEQARDAVRELKRGGRMPEGGVTIWLQGGDYHFTQSLALNQEDSGCEKSPITWRAVPNERVRFLGGKPLSGFKPLDDEEVLARLNAQARAHVLVADLPAHGITDFGALRSRGFGRPTVTAHGELFFNNRPMTLARFPNVGAWELIAAYPEGSGQDDDHGRSIGALPDGFLYDTERPKLWRSIENLWVHGYWAFDWANTYERVASMDVARRWLRTAEPYGLYGFRPGQRFYFLNILEELDEPGEWYLEAASGRLFFWPPQPMETGETLFSTLEQPFVTMTDVEHVTFQGIVFEASRGNAIEIRGGASCRIVGCLIRNIGNWAVIINGGIAHSVDSCDVLDIGDGGVSLTGGDRQTLERGNHYVNNSRFVRLGRWSKCYVPAVLMNGVGLRASHNHIYEHPHCAIQFDGNDHLIEFNDIHHIALETGDVGAIYTGRDFTFRGNRIVHNFIHETGGVGIGSVGVYMDDCVSGTEVFGNVFYRVQWAMFIGGGRDHLVENNLFVECDPAVRADARGLDRKPVWRNMVDKTMRERLAGVPAELYRERYPEIKSLDVYYGPPGGPPITGDDFKGIPPEGNRIIRNVCVGDWLDFGWYAESELFTVQDNYVTTDPSQVGGPEEGFALPEDSPAWSMGFQRIPFEKIGLYANEDRDRLPAMAD